MNNWFYNKKMKKMTFFTGAQKQSYGKQFVTYSFNTQEYKKDYVETVPLFFLSKHVLETHFTTVFPSVFASRG